jgi:hypothetical protein
LPELFAIDRDVAHRLGHDGGEEDRLPGEQVHLAEEAGVAMTDDLVAGGIDHRDLPLDYRDERIALVANLKQRLADLCPPFLAVLGQRRKLRLREHTTCRTGHPDKATHTRAVPFTAWASLAGA